MLPLAIAVPCSPSVMTPRAYQPVPVPGKEVNETLLSVGCKAVKNTFPSRTRADRWRCPMGKALELCSEESGADLAM